LPFLQFCRLTRARTHVNVPEKTNVRCTLLLSSSQQGLDGDDRDGV